MTYSEKLKSPKWQRKRLEILNRDNFTCKSCGDSENMLSVHHKRYFPNTEPWEYEDDLLVTLCQDCHDANHFLIKSIKCIVEINFIGFEKLDELHLIIRKLSNYTTENLINLKKSLK